MSADKIKTIDELVNENDKVNKTKDKDKIILIDLMKLATDNIVDYFMPELFIRDNQSGIIEKMNEYYKKELIETRRRIISKLIDYLNKFNFIKDSDYEKYIIESNRLRKKIDIFKKDKITDMKIINKNMSKNNIIDQNVCLYAYFKYKIPNIKPKDLVELTIDKSDYYIDFKNNKLYIKDDIYDINSIKVLKILLRESYIKDYELLLSDDELLFNEIKLINNTYIFEKNGRKLSSQDLSKMYSYRKR